MTGVIRLTCLLSIIVVSRAPQQVGQMTCRMNKVYGSVNGTSGVSPEL